MWCRVICYVALKMAIEIVSLPINSMVIFHRFLYVYQRVLYWVYHINIWLVVCNMNFIFHILGIIIPTDFHIFQRG